MDNMHLKVFPFIDCSLIILFVSIKRQREEQKKNDGGRKKEREREIVACIVHNVLKVQCTSVCLITYYIHEKVLPFFAVEFSAVCKSHSLADFYCRSYFCTSCSRENVIAHNKPVIGSLLIIDFRKKLSTLSINVRETLGIIHHAPQERQQTIKYACSPREIHRDRKKLHYDNEECVQHWLDIIKTYAEE